MEVILDERNCFGGPVFYGKKQSGITFFPLGDKWREKKQSENSFIDDLQNVGSSGLRSYVEDGRHIYLGSSSC